MFVTKEFTFDSAHFLPNYQGKCEKMHGHTYKLHIIVEGEVNKDDGMVYDFCELKKIVTKTVLSKLDHSLINDLISIPSVENIAIWIWEELKDFIPLYSIRLWETPTSFITYFGPEKEKL